MSRKPGKVAVHAYSDGGALVRGTTDPVLAFKHLLDEHIAGGVNLGGLVNDARQLPPGDDRPADDADALLDEVNYWLARADPGRFRILPGGAWDPDWKWCVFRQNRDAQGRGIFSGVEFQP
jgi:hypothetical protein